MPGRHATRLVGGINNRRVRARRILRMILEPFLLVLSVVVLDVHGQLT
jgi:hypothetical protein